VRVVVHDLGRSGVPVVLLRYLSVLAAEERRRVVVLAGHDGPLRSDIEALGVSVRSVWDAGRRAPGRTAAAAASALGVGGLHRRALALDVRRVLRGLPEPDVVLVHGAGALVVPGVVPDGVPVVVHVHELDSALGRGAPPNVLRQLLDSAAVVVGVTPEVGAALQRRCGFHGSIEVLPGVPDTTAPLSALVDDADRLGDRGAVVGVGAPDWRKGADRMQAVAHSLARRGRSAPVRWIGGAPAGREAVWVDARSAVDWVPSTADPWAAAEPVAVVVVPSREDPLPLVVLEAGVRGHAVVATATGGLVDLLADGRGVVVPPGDLPALVDAVDDLLADPAAAARAGTALRDHVLVHHDPESVGRRWWDLVTSAAGGRLR
jgi:glycosyltransferase involved in cell wall biosynthesis